jgi:N-methylhydantoinase B
MTAPDALRRIREQVMWDRLLAVVEEQAETMIRTAFSTTVREAGDLSAGVFTPDGRMIAQAVTGTPGHVNSMAESVRHFLRAFPPETMREGDHFITNDPWYATGHLHDLTMVSPAFHRGRLVALFANTAHVIDIGGLGMGPDGRSVFEEGLFIPILRCFAAGERDETFFAFLRANSRRPAELEGDVYSLAACNEAGIRRLRHMLEEFGLDDLSALAEHVFSASRQATEAAIASLPRGTFRAEIFSDGYDRPIRLAAAMTIAERTITVDFTGTSPLERRGINVPPAYTRAYASFGLKAVLAPEIPNNWASLVPFHFVIPEGLILNAPRPWPVSARHVIGQLLPDLMMGCLAQVVPERVIAESFSALWNPPLRGGPMVSGEERRNAPPIEDFEIITFNSGGMGARFGRDGLDATAFPSGVRTMPVEATENAAPLVIWRKELRPDSGGAGRWRGGLGQIMEIGVKDDSAFLCNAIFDRVHHPPRGRSGGGEGAAGRVALSGGAELRPKGLQMIPAGEHLILELPGGGGMGDPWQREPDLVAADVAEGLVSPAAARALYGVVVDERGSLDEEATARLRAARPAGG